MMDIEFGCSIRSCVLSPAIVVAVVVVVYVVVYVDMESGPLYVAPSRCSRQFNVAVWSKRDRQHWILYSHLLKLQ